MPDEEGAMERCQEVRQEAQVNVAEECHEAMGMKASQVMQELRGMLANLGDVAVAPEEEKDQLEVLRSIGNALLQDMRGVGSTPEILSKEAHTVRYLDYTLVLMKVVLTERERCLHQVQALDQVLAAIWRREVPSQVIQLLKHDQAPWVSRAEEATAQLAQKAVDRAFRML